MRVTKPKDGRWVRSAAGLLLLPVLAGLGCHKEEPVAPSLPQVAKGDRSITGRVALKGTPPEMKSRLVTCDPGAGKPKILVPDRTVRVSASGGLGDVFVYVKNGPRGSGAGEPPALLDQVDCHFEPHALAVQIGQPIRIHNSDPTFHNVHWDPAKNSPMNVGFGAAPAAEQIRAFSAAEFVPIRCDVHDWMRSTIGVFDHPFFAVTDADGNFTIRHLPAGTYQVTAFHPLYGEGETKTVTVGTADQTTSFDFAAK